MGSENRLSKRVTGNLSFRMIHGRNARKAPDRRGFPQSLLSIAVWLELIRHAIAGLARVLLCRELGFFSCWARRGRTTNGKSEMRGSSLRSEDRQTCNSNGREQRQQQIPFGDDNKRTDNDKNNGKNNGKSNSNGNSRSPTGMTTKGRTTTIATAGPSTAPLR
jgi:hypothetical protein